jgi:hypothetical protein
MRKLVANTSFLIVLLVLISCNSGVAGTSSKKIHAVRVASSISIDGVLEESDWKNAETLSDFQQYDPVESADPTEKTDVKVLFDDNALYVGVVCHDSDPGGIVRQLTRRDRTTQSDRFSVTIDSYHDHQTAFLFSGSVSNVQTDGVLSNDGRSYDIQWDAVWEFRSHISSDGWSGEFRIPFSALRFAASDSGYEWGINFRRYIARKNETDEWVMLPRSETPPGVLSSVSTMGNLVGLERIQPPLHLEVVPYTVLKESYLSQPKPFPLQQKFSPNIGADIKYGVTNNFTLDLAVNPDFGQVEVDQAVLNLSVFETYYPEKRPFFLEGSQLFAFGTMFDNSQMRLFYSRRVGKHPEAPYGYPLSGYNFDDAPQTTRILGAGKFSGRTNSGLSIGALSAFTSEEDGVQVDYNGNRLPAIILEPKATYNVFRVKQDFADNSYIGMIATNLFRDTYRPIQNGGIDWNLRLDDGNYAIDGYLSGCINPTFPDERTTGGAGKIGLGKLQGEHWLAFSLYDFSTRNYNIDEIGYYSQPREHGGFTQVAYKENFAPSPIRRYVVNLETDYRWNWDGISTLHLLEFNPAFELENFWNVAIDYKHRLAAYDDENSGIIGLYRRPAMEDLDFQMQTDVRQPVSLFFDSHYYGTTKGKCSYINSLTLTWRPATWMEYSPGLTVVRTRNEETWVIPIYTLDNQLNPQFNLFGDRDWNEFDFNLRGTITFTTDLSLQFFTQLLLANGMYSNFRKLVGPESFILYDYLNDTLRNAAVKFYGNPNFNEMTINANIVLRWEYMPGSTFYLVWTQARYGNNGLYANNFTTNFADAFRLPMDNVILAKFSYRLGM